MLAADPPPGARDDRDATLAQLRHAGSSPFGCLMPRRPLRLAVGRGREQTGRIPGVSSDRGGHVGGLEPPWKMSTRRRPRTRLWSWSPSRRRRHGPRTSARPRQRRPTSASPAPLGAAGRPRARRARAAPGRSPGRSTPAPGEVGRNVQLAGVDIGGLSEDELAGRVGDVAADFARHAGRAGRRRRRLRDHRRRDRPDGRRGRTTAAAPSRSATSSFLLARPFAWATSLFSTQRGAAPAPGERRAGRRRRSSRSRATRRTPPTEPTVELVDGAFEVVPGVDGDGTRHRRGRRAASRAPPRRRWPRTPDVVRLELEVGPIPPLGTRGGGAGARPRPPRRS